MAFNDVPLNDAGRDYYNQQFGNRVQNIRKNGAPPTARGSGCLGTGGAAGGGIFAIIVVIRIIAAVAWVGSSNYDSGTNYNYEPSNITIPDPPPVNWQDNINVDPPADPNVLNPNQGPWQPGQPIIRPPLDPPAVPGDDKPDGDK